MGGLRFGMRLVFLCGSWGAGELWYEGCGYWLLETGGGVNRIGWMEVFSEVGIEHSWMIR